MSIVSADVPWEKVLYFLVDNPQSEVVGRVAKIIDDNGDVWTYPDSCGTYGLRVVCPENLPEATS